MLTIDQGHHHQDDDDDDDDDDDLRGFLFLPLYGYGSKPRTLGDP